MQLLSVDRNSARCKRTTVLGLERGFLATGTACLRAAEEALTHFDVDILVADAETLDDALGDLIGLAEERNAGVTTFLWSRMVLPHFDALTEAFPSLVAVLGEGIDPRVVIDLGVQYAVPLSSRYRRPRSKRNVPLPLAA